MNPELRNKLLIWFKKTKNINCYFNDNSLRHILRNKLIENWDDAMALKLSKHLATEDQFKFT